MRAILVLIGLAVLVLVALMSFGMVRIEQTGNASLPTLRIEGGKSPQFHANVGKVDVGTTNATVRVPTIEMKNTTVQLPTIEVRKAGNTQAPAQ